MELESDVLIGRLGLRDEAGPDEPTTYNASRLGLVPVALPPGPSARPSGATAVAERPAAEPDPVGPSVSPPTTPDTSERQAEAIVEKDAEPSPERPGAPPVVIPLLTAQSAPSGIPSEVCRKVTFKLPRHLADEVRSRAHRTRSYQYVVVAHALEEHFHLSDCGACGDRAEGDGCGFARRIMRALGFCRNHP